MESSSNDFHEDRFHYLYSKRNPGRVSGQIHKKTCKTAEYSTPVISATWRWRQEDFIFNVSLGNLVSQKSWGCSSVSMPLGSFPRYNKQTTGEKVSDTLRNTMEST